MTQAAAVATEHPLRRELQMSEKNKAILKQANAAVVKGDYEAFLSHCTGDVKWVFVGDKTLKGKEAVRRYMKSTYIDPPKFVVDLLIAEGDFVTAIGEIDMTDESGKTVHSAYCDVWRVRDGMLAELRAFVVEIKETAKNGR
jgi:ketosteroid isomerase-like protein